MAKSRFAKHLLPGASTGTSIFSYSYMPQTLVWRRITPADCVARGGPMPSADRVGRLMNEIFVASSWHAIGERDVYRHPRDPIKPKLRAPAPPPAEMSPPALPPTPPPRQPQPRFTSRYPDLHCEEMAADYGPTDLRPPVRYRFVCLSRRATTAVLLPQLLICPEDYTTPARPRPCAQTSSSSRRPPPLPSSRTRSFRSSRT